MFSLDRAVPFLFKKERGALKILVGPFYPFFAKERVRYSKKRLQALSLPKITSYQGEALYAAYHEIGSHRNCYAPKNIFDDNA